MSKHRPQELQERLEIDVADDPDEYPYGGYGEAPLVKGVVRQLADPDPPIRPRLRRDHQEDAHERRHAPEPVKIDAHGEDLPYVHADQDPNPCCGPGPQVPQVMIADPAPNLRVQEGEQGDGREPEGDGGDVNHGSWVQRGGRLNLPFWSVVSQ